MHNLERQGKHEPTDEESVFPLADTDSEDEDRLVVMRDDGDSHRTQRSMFLCSLKSLYKRLFPPRFTELNEDGSKKPEEEVKGMPSFWLTIFQVIYLSQGLYNIHSTLFYINVFRNTSLGKWRSPTH